MFFRRGAARESVTECEDCKKALKYCNSETVGMFSAMFAPFISAETRLKLFGVPRANDVEFTFFDHYHCWFPIVFMLLFITFTVTDVISKYVCICTLALIILLLVSSFLRQHY